MLIGDVWLCSGQSNMKMAVKQNRPANLFNGMIHPLIPYAIRGAIWYERASKGSRSRSYTFLRHEKDGFVTRSGGPARLPWSGFLLLSA